MIETLRLQNFRSHAATTMKLDRLTVLVGRNGAGKTSILRALHCISWLPYQPADEVFSDELHAEHIVRSQHDTFEIMAWAGGSFQLVARRAQGEWRYQLASSNGGYSPGQTELPLAVADNLQPAITLQLIGPRLAAPVVYSPSPKMERDGYGLAAVLAHLKLRDSDRFDAITEEARQVVPTLRRLRIDTVAGPANVPQFSLLVDQVGADGVPAHALSEGTLMTLGLLTRLHAEDSPRLVLIDDIDHALHPKAQWELVGLLRKTLERIPDLQIVATTHSPYLVDVLEPHEVRVCALDAKGVSHCRSLADHPKARLLDVLSTGEFLGAEGEDWVAAGA